MFIVQRYLRKYVLYKSNLFNVLSNARSHRNSSCKIAPHRTLFLSMALQA